MSSKTRDSEEGDRVHLLGAESSDEEEKVDEKHLCGTLSSCAVQSSTSGNESCLCFPCCWGPGGQDKCPLPDPHRPDTPVDHCHYELRECFPCVSMPVNYFLIDRFPFVRWLKRYNLRWLISDIIAGLTVGLMVVPQALTYASVAGLPKRYGLYSSFMGVFIYTFFGTSKDVTLGPTAILSILTASLTEGCGSEENERVPCAVALTLLSGLVQLALGILNLGFLVNFIPVPVISGFTSAAAITIAVGQLKHLFGISDVRRPVYLAIYDLLRHINKTKGWDLLLGVTCVVMVIALKYLQSLMDTLLKKEKLHWVKRMVYKVLWLMSTARNAVVVMIGAFLGYRLSTQTWFADQITLIHDQHSSLPPFHPPHLNSTIVKELGIGIGVAPLIGFLESIAISKAFARQGGYKIQANQELIALGLSNVASSFVGSYPITGSFSRTAVNAQSGVCTPAAGIITGGVVLLAIALLGPYFHYIPEPSLAAIIIVAVLPTVNIRIVCRILVVRYIDVVPLMFSFLFTLFLGIEWGVPIAVVVYICFHLYRLTRPRHELKVQGGVVCVKFNGGWNYPGVEYIWKRVSIEITTAESNIQREKTNAVVFDCSGMPEIDFTTAQAMKESCEDLEKKGIQVFIVNCQPHVLGVLKKMKIQNLTFSSSLESTLQIIDSRTSLRSDITVEGQLEDKSMEDTYV